MGFTKVFKITKEPRTFQAGESTGFQLSLGSQYYDRKTKQKEWTNYKAVVFAKGNQLDFYSGSLVVGTIVEISADDLKIDNYNPEYPSIELIDARLGGIFTGSQPQQAQPRQQAPQQQAPRQQSPQQQAPQQQAPQKMQPQYNDPPMDFDDDIPFAPIGLQNRKLLNII